MCAFVFVFVCAWFCLCVSVVDVFVFVCDGVSVCCTASVLVGYFVCLLVCCFVTTIMLIFQIGTVIMLLC